MASSWLQTAQAKTSTFIFAYTADPHPNFCFDKLSAPRNGVDRRPLKRRRPMWDVDGDSAGGKKKRRLRLHLITSRLSRPYSAPATNIISRGASKIAIWAKSRRLDQGVLRKAAIMNHVRMRSEAARIIAHAPYRHIVPLSDLTAHRPRPHLPPSPLGLSNYDALDLEDEMEGESCDSSVYSDFNIMSPTNAADEDPYAYLDDLDGIPHDLPEERAPPAPDERLTEIVKEKERQREICFIKFEV